MQKESLVISKSLKVGLTITLLLNVILIVWYLLASFFSRKLSEKVVTHASTWHEEKKALFRVLPSDTGAIVFLGNSIVEQYPLEEYFRTTKVKNRGISGNGITSLLNRIDQTIASKPAVIVIEGAINDFFDGHEPPYVFGVFQQLIKKIKVHSPSTRICVLSALPIKRYMPKIKAYNTLVAQYCTDQQLTYINTYTPFLINNSDTPNTALTTDGIHLNEKGYALLTGILEPYLKSHF